MATSARSRPRLALAGGFDGGGGGGRWMSPELREAIRLLQLSRRELIEEIRKELEADPAQEKSR
jgi:Sigma-54 factor, Activator interacting domain (AID)